MFHKSNVNEIPDISWTKIEQIAADTVKTPSKSQTLGMQ